MGQNFHTSRGAKGQRVGKAVASANDKSYEPSKQKGVIYKEESRSRLCPAPSLLFIQEGAKEVRYTRHKHSRALARSLVSCTYVYGYHGLRTTHVAARGGGSRVKGEV